MLYAVTLKRISVAEALMISINNCVGCEKRFIFRAPNECGNVCARMRLCIWCFSRNQSPWINIYWFSLVSSVLVVYHKRDILIEIFGGLFGLNVCIEIELNKSKLIRWFWCWWWETFWKHTKKQIIETNKQRTNFPNFRGDCYKLRRWSSAARYELVTLNLNTPNKRIHSHDDYSGRSFALAHTNTQNCIDVSKHTIDYIHSTGIQVSENNKTGLCAYFVSARPPKLSFSSIYAMSWAYVYRHDA